MPKFDKPDSPNIIWGTDALDADLTRPDDSYIQTGWTQVKPPYEYENYSMNKLYQGFAYYNQQGIPEWDSVTEYQAGKSYIQGSNNRVYKCIQTHTNRSPATAGNEAYWERLRVTDTEIKTLFNADSNPPVFACRAWANYDGTTDTLRASGNIASIVRVSKGLYTVNFATPMQDNNYSVSLSFGVQSRADSISLEEPLSQGSFQFEILTDNDGAVGSERQDKQQIHIIVVR